MKTNAKKRFLACLIAFLMVFTYVPAAAYATDTATGTESEITLLDGQVKITNDLSTGSLTDGVVTLTAKGGSAAVGQKTNTVVIYNETGKTATMAFDYAVSNYKAYTGLDSESGTYNAILEADGSVTITFTGKQANSNNEATLTLSNFSIETVADSSDITLNYDSSLGSITAAGETAAFGTTVTATYTDGLALAATAADGAEFLAWINAETGKILSEDAEFTFNPTASATVEAVFAGEASGAYYMAGSAYLLTDLDEATAKAQTLNSKVVALMNDVTLAEGTYTIPAGVTLLVPFDDENTLYTTAPAGENGNYTEPVAYRTLTLAEGAELVINGALSLSAKHNAAASNTRGSGAPMGDVSFIEMEKNSTVTVKDGGALYAYGYITGEGTVTAESGATVYENFQIEDFRGGTVTSYMAVNNVDKGVLPISQYYVQNIEVPMVLEAGATEYCYTSLYLSSSALGSSVKFIGSSDAMFILEDGYVTKSYDGTKDRLIVEGDGNMSLSPIKVQLESQGIDSASFELPINSNITVNINEGEVVINQDVALLPGAEINIAEGAACTLGEGVSVYVYDADQWGSYCGASNVKMLPVLYAPGKTYERTEADLVDAAVKVNGTLDATAGALYTTASSDYATGHANIYSTGNGIVKIISGEQECTYQFTQSGTEGTFTGIYLLPANLKNEDGTYLQTYDETAGAYKYADGVWARYEEEAEHVHTVVTDAAVEATCTETGLTEGSHCSECNEVIVAQETVAALGHTEVTDAAAAATCTEAGLTEGSHCSVCNEVIVAQETVAATGHTAVTDAAVAATCTTAGLTEGSHCSVCNEVIKAQETVAAKGHTAVTDAAVAATCTTAGLTEGSHCSVCNEVIKAQETVAAKGHTAVTDAAVAATCTTAGKTEGSHCSVCNEVIKAQETVAAKGHTAVTDAAVAATCTETGLTEGSHCSVCNAVITAQETVAALGHTWAKTYTVDTAASMTAAGSKSYHCSVCDAAGTAVKIPKIKSAKVTALVYNGSKRAPVPAIYNFNGYKLKKGTDYTVVYKNAKATKVVTPKLVGKYTAVITFTGNYKGTIQRQFNINPKGTAINKLTKGKKQITVKWTKRTVQVTGYEIQCSTTAKFTPKTTKKVTVKNAKTNTKTIKSLKAKKKYWVRVRTYKTVNGTKFYSGWSTVRTVKTK